MTSDELDDSFGRVSTLSGLSWTFPKPVPAPPGVGSCTHCLGDLVILGYLERRPGSIEIVGAPNYAWAHAADLSRTCTRTLVDPVKPYSGWVTETQQQPVRDAVDAAYDEQDEALAAGESS